MYKMMLENGKVDSIAEGGPEVDVFVDGDKKVTAVLKGGILCLSILNQPDISIKLGGCPVEFGIAGKTCLVKTEDPLVSIKCREVSIFLQRIEEQDTCLLKQSAMLKAMEIRG